VEALSKVAVAVLVVFGLAFLVIHLVGGLLLNYLLPQL
jgi:hypothetical protein